MPQLEERGVRVLAVDLPSVGVDPAEPPDLSADAAAVTRVLDDTGGTFVVCGHSYGGMVITVAAAGRSDVVELVYLCAFMPDAVSRCSRSRAGLRRGSTCSRTAGHFRISRTPRRSATRTATRRRARARSPACARR